MTKKKNSTFNELIYNILLPTVILNYGTKWLGVEYAVPVLIGALALPLGYSIYDFKQKQKINIFGVLGFISILLSGGLALMHAEGSVMVMKETLFPLILGLIVLIASYSKRPLLNELILNPQIFEQEKLEAKIHELGRHKEFMQHLKKSNIFFAFSFLVSAILNYILAASIFTPIDASIVGDARSAIINEQLGKMNGLSWAVIVIPSMAFLVFVLWYLFSGIKKITGFEMKDLMIDPKKDHRS
jgi:hypothetical protein